MGVGALRGSEFLSFSANAGDGIPHRAIVSSRPSG
jgi:hypothetical protein